MSAIEDPERADADGTDLNEFPRFDLEYLYDDDESPTEVTVFVDDPAALSTNWITADVDHAVPLDEVR